MNYDGHVHTPYCPHGSKDTLESYVKAAINQGFKGITFTEHAPLPNTFVDPAPTKDSAMEWNDVDYYFEDLQKLKQKYKDNIHINLGFEVDYIIGYEKETKALLDHFGPYLDDAILSVHFLEKEGNYYCVDYSPELFSKIVEQFGSLAAVYDAYFHTVKQSIYADLGKYKPKRIGHITLVNKFKKNYSEIPDYTNQMEVLLELIKKYNFELDYNGAGVVKEYCGEPYPPEWVVRKAIEKNIPLVYGSDAHTAKGIGQGQSELVKQTTLSTPSGLHRDGRSKNNFLTL